MNKFGVPASANAYIDQFVAALLVLLRTARSGRPGEMSLERLDDIELREDGNLFDIVQVKSHLAGGNLTDRAVDLWKTFRVWIELYNADQLDIALTTLTLLTTQRCGQNTACRILRDRGSVAEAESILLAIADEKNESNQTAYGLFRSMTPGERSQLLTSVRIIDGESGTSDLEAQLANELETSVFSPSHLIHMMEELLGWWILRVSSNLRDPLDAIRSSEVVDKIRAIMRSLRPESLPVSPEIQAYAREWGTADESHVFVRQLRLVDAPDSLIIGALLDYLRLEKQLSEWLRKSLLFADDGNTYSSELIDAWKFLFDVMIAKLTSEDDDAQRRAGFNLFEEVMRRDFPIRPECRTPFIMRGYYHRLANELKVGWHPKFRELVK